MEISFHEKITKLLSLITDLNSLGWSKKRIAEELSIFPSVLSVLVNRVGKDLKKLEVENKLNSMEISMLFNNINNISEKRLRQNIDRYISLLEKVRFKPKESSLNKYFTDLHHSTPYDKLKMFFGTYLCYYISSFNYKVKCEPLFIGQSECADSVWVQKGNNNGPTKLEGILYSTNSQVLTIQLIEENTVIKDQFIAHFNMPPLYNKIEILKGLSISVSNSMLPISRKVILKKISETIQENEIDQISTLFYEPHEIDNPIVDYLYSEKSYLEYYHPPRPQFDESDLKKEMQIVSAHI